MINIPWFLDPHKIPAVRINTFANALMFILRGLKDILSGKLLKKNNIMSRIGIIIPFRIKYGLISFHFQTISFSCFLNVDS